MKKKLLFLATISLFSLGCSSVAGELRYSAPSVLANTTRPMKTAGFWVSRHPFPDKIILNREKIDAFNGRTEKEMKVIKDVTKIGPTYPGKELVATLRESLADVRRQGLFFLEGQTPPENFYGDVEKQMDLSAVAPEINVRYGFIVHYADQRILPTETGLYATPGDVDFDELQNSALDVATPVVVLHESKDKEWVYALGAISDGWIKKEHIAFCGFEEFKEYVRASDFVVVISPKADIFLDPSMTQYYDHVKMGVRLSLKEKAASESLEVVLPARDSDGKLATVSGYLKREDASIGFLPYTPRVVFTQAFKLLNAPYGWGDMYGEQDCSRFLQEIFAAVGITMPRNSSAQMKLGELLAHFPAGVSPEEKRKTLNEKAVGGITTLYLKGHILLFLGTVNDLPYAIHATWGYRDNDCQGNCARVINRVVVSDLSLGEGSSKGSLLERLISISRIDDRE